MNAEHSNRISELLRKHESKLLADWINAQMANGRSDLNTEADLRRESGEFMTLFQAAARNGNFTNIEAPEWRPVRDMLESLSRSRGRQGISPVETATFVFSLKQPIFERVAAEETSDSGALAQDLWAVASLLDRLGLFTTECHQKAREDVIRRQQQELLELSTPVVRLWEGVLALPLIGTLDSARTQVVMESLLKEIMETGSEIAIIDITGVPMVDTLVAQHLLKTVAAARLMGADCIISGIRPQIAQTIVHLGVNLTDVVTKATLEDAFRLALDRSNLYVTAKAAEGR
ncbi:MAG TPA: STAS domain-containing protein [Bryobacteraceae bacterium]|nr:STAS domain-containing protein [Bryobacteraceae bacterium]